MKYNHIMYIFCIIIGVVAIAAQAISHKVEHGLLFAPLKINDSTADDRLMKSGLSIVNKKIMTSDAEILDALFCPNNTSDKLLLFAHGNAGHIYDDLQLINNYSKICSMLSFDYRGYGRSTGKPSETGMHNDIISAWMFAQNVLNYKPENIILYGRSLGCANVLWLGQKLVKLNSKLPKGIIIESGFYNLDKIITDKFVPCLSYLASSKFNNIKYIKKINKTIPLFIIHSKDDELITINHAHQLIKDGGYDINKDFLMIAGGHNSLILNDKYYQTINTFIYS